jgi:exodeoxyribonuclease VIII
MIGSINEVKREKMIETLEELRHTLDKQGNTLFLSHVNPGIYRTHEFLSQSDLKVIAEYSPAHFRYYRRHPKPDSDPKKLGRASHVAILEPLKFEAMYMKGPRVDKRTKAGRTLWEEAEESARESGRELLLPEHYDAPDEMRESVRSNPAVSELLEAGVAERASFGKVHGVDGKALTDYYRPRDHAIVDLKSTRCASRRSFERDIRSYRYHWQAVWYTDLIEAITGKTPSFTIVAVETVPPYGSAVYTIKPDLMAIARREMIETLKIYQECMRTGQWPGYPSHVNEVSAHGWEWDAYMKALSA